MKQLFALLILLTSFSAFSGEVRNPTDAEDTQILRDIVFGNFRAVKKWFKKEKINPRYMLNGRSYFGYSFKNPEVDEENFYWDTHFTKDHQKMSQLLLDFIDGEVNLGGPTGIASTGLQEAARNYNDGAVKWLISKGARAGYCGIDDQGNEECGWGGRGHALEAIFKAPGAAPYLGACFNFKNAVRVYTETERLSREDYNITLREHGIREMHTQSLPHYLKAFKKMSINSVEEALAFCKKRYPQS